MDLRAVPGQIAKVRVKLDTALRPILIYGVMDGVDFDFGPMSFYGIKGTG